MYGWRSWLFTVIGDTLKTYSPYEDIMMSEQIEFKGDTLIIGRPSEEKPPLTLLPFSTISIGGKRVALPESNDPQGEEKFDTIMEELCKQPLNDATLNEWNTLELFTDGAVAETCDNYLADLYMKHPKSF